LETATRTTGNTTTVRANAGDTPVVVETVGGVTYWWEWEDYVPEEDYTVFDVVVENEISETVEETYTASETVPAGATSTSTATATATRTVE
jgi:hypothetical protein